MANKPISLLIHQLSSHTNMTYLLSLSLFPQDSHWKQEALRWKAEAVRSKREITIINTQLEEKDTAIAERDSELAQQRGTRGREEVSSWCAGLGRGLLVLAVLLLAVLVFILLNVFVQKPHRFL